MPLHSCANCVYFLRSAQIRCTIPEAARVLDWQAGNRCKHFDFQQVSSEMATSGNGVAPAGGPGRNPKDRWNQLFGK
jgi:hypothetical protein